MPRKELTPFIATISKEVLKNKFVESLYLLNYLLSWGLSPLYINNITHLKWSVSDL